MKKDKQLNRIDIGDTLPHQINAPDFTGTGITMEPPFENSFGVIIGDSRYTSEDSPLENWSDATDPAVMAGDEWVHPTNDIGWNTAENRDLLEKEKLPQGYPFMHPSIDVSKSQD